MVDDPWLHVRREAVLGELARLQLRFDDAVVHLGRAAETSRRLGFLQTEAYQVSSLGRAQCQAGDYETGAATLELAIEKAEATGDVRMAALARVHLGRVLRALGERERARTALETATAWHRAAGGGEQAALGECLLAAMDAEERVAGAEERLVAILERGAPGRRRPCRGLRPRRAGPHRRRGRRHRHRGRAAAQEADRRMEAASHFITERDRTDADVGDADRPDDARAQIVAPGPSAASVISAASAVWRARLPRSFITMKASRPADDDGDADELPLAAAPHPATGTPTRPRAQAARPGRRRSCRSGSSSGRRPSARGRRRR